METHRKVKQKGLFLGLINRKKKTNLLYKVLSTQIYPNVIDYVHRTPTSYKPCEVLEEEVKSGVQQQAAADWFGKVLSASTAEAQPLE